MKYSRLLLLFIGVSGTAFANQGQDFSGLSPHEALEKANAWYGQKQASVQVFPDSIKAKFPDGSEGEVKLGDEFLVSLAPYVNRMHPCEYHVATGCTGELKNTELDVRIYDEETGKTLKYGQMTTNENGFVDLWLPREKSNLKVTFNYKDKSVTRVISTTDTSLTCITDIKLT